MSEHDFHTAFAEFWGKAKHYNAGQRSTLLIGFKAHLNATLTEAGAPHPDKAPEKAPEKEKAAEGKGHHGHGHGQAAPVTGSRVSTKVLSAPGGASSISLGDDGSASQRSSVKVHSAPGGASSISLGDDSARSGAKEDDPGSRPKKFTAGRKALAPAGGHSHDIFGGEIAPSKTSARSGNASSPTAAAGAGGSSTAAAEKTSSEEPPAEKTSAVGGDELGQPLLAEISAAVYRKGKVRDTYNKLCVNKKAFMQEDVRDGITHIVGVPISDAQAAKLMQKFAKDTKNGMTYNEFVKMLTI